MVGLGVQTWGSGLATSIWNLLFSGLRQSLKKSTRGGVLGVVSIIILLGGTEVEGDVSFLLRCIRTN